MCPFFLLENKKNNIENISVKLIYFKNILFVLWPILYWSMAPPHIGMAPPHIGLAILAFTYSMCRAVSVGLAILISYSASKITSIQVHHFHSFVAIVDFRASDRLIKTQHKSPLCSLSKSKSGFHVFPSKMKAELLRASVFPGSCSLKVSLTKRG